jgi:hypothetical protein
MNRLVILLIACVAYVGSVMVGYGIGRTDGKAICKGDQAAALTKARKDDIAALLDW